MIIYWLRENKIKDGFELCFFGSKNLEYQDFFCIDYI